jgi:hypothetical protein
MSNNVAYIDIETRKVPAPAGFPQRLRWQVFMVGIGLWEGESPAVYLYDEFDPETGARYSEAELLRQVREFLAENGVTELRYAATREFDEMVLRGRFTNARRAHLPRPGWEPNLDDLPVRWVNIRKNLAPTPPAPRGDWDCASRDCPAVWAAGDLERVRAHCLEDVVSMMRAEN